MYSLGDRTYCSNLGELRKAIADYSDETDVYVAGVLGTYVHTDELKTLVSFDEDPMDADYLIDEWDQKE